MKTLTSISGNILDLSGRTVFPGTIDVANGRIKRIARDGKKYATYILPGFIDAHIHIESSMLPPSEFARLAVPHGTVATVSDPHEIANVLGIPGVDYMIENAKTVPLKFFFGAPSCVPATSFETAGAVLDAAAVSALLARPGILYLSEMMNFPGVIHRDTQVLAKIEAAKKEGKPVDGHAPGLRGDDLKRYIAAGISTDHESFQLDEAKEKLGLGMKCIIREGSAAKNFGALHPVLKNCPGMVMFGSDDKHPNDLVIGHINQLVASAVALGYDLFDVLEAACATPIRQYGLPVGQLRVGDPADFIEVEDLKTFRVRQTVIAGRVVAENGTAAFAHTRVAAPNNFSLSPVSPSDFAAGIPKGKHIRVIEALDGQLITNARKGKPGGDIQKIAVVNRYHKAVPAVGFIKNFGLKKGAIASSVAHDSHNIVAVGVTDADIAHAVNLLIETNGGISAVAETIEEVLPLPIAGLMSPARGEEVAAGYEKLDALAKELGSALTAPFMTLSFMALPVIPSLKMTDKGLFDGVAFTHVPVVLP